MKCVIDTNVPIVANTQEETPASELCVQACVDLLYEFYLDQRQLVLDDAWFILQEYQHKLHSSGQPGIGDAFLRWVLTNRANPQRCELVTITPVMAADGSVDFAEFPIAKILESFDRSDRKFVAVALAHPQKPPIVNATDSDWWHYKAALDIYGIKIEFVCHDMIFKNSE